MDGQYSSPMECLQRLSGMWIGEGVLEFPTIQTAPYREELTFIPGEGKPYLHYEQRSWRKDESGREVASHWESGFWRILPSGEIELTCAQSGGRLEAGRGILQPTDDGFTLILKSTVIANDTKVRESRRVFELAGESLRYEMEMQTAAVDSLTRHLRAELRRRK